MIPFNATVEELEEMIALAEEDEGMLDLLLKAKAYYLLKVPAESVMAREKSRTLKAIEKLEQKIIAAEKKMKDDMGVSQLPKTIFSSQDIRDWTRT